MALSKIDDRGLNTPIDLLDNEKIRLGTGNDLEFVHNGTDSEIKGTTGTLTIKNANNLNLYTAVNEEAIVAVANGSVSLYHNANKKLETSSGGVTITGNAVASSKFRGNDDVKLSLGDGEDLQIYHDGSHSFIRDTGTGMLSIDGSQINLHNAAGSEYMLQAVENGAVSLYCDNSKKLETASHGVEVTGKLTFSGDGHTQGIELGADADIVFYHDNSDGYLDNNVGDLYLRNDGSSTSEKVRIQAKGGEQSIVCVADGAVELYHNGSKKLESIAAGVHITDQLFVGTSNSVDDANTRAIIGRGGDCFLGVRNTTGAGSVGIKFGDSADEDVGMIEYAHGENSMRFKTNTSERMRITEAGCVIIGSDSLLGYGANPSGATEISCDDVNNGALRLYVATSSNNQAYLRFRHSSSDNGGIQRDGTGTGVVFFAGSDRRIKKNITAMPGTLDKLNQIQLKSFDLKDDSGSGIGPIAQDLVSIFPGKVKKDSGDDGTGDTVPDGKEAWSVATGFTWELIKAVQELTAKNTALETRIVALEAA